MNGIQARTQTNSLRYKTKPGHYQGFRKVENYQGLLEDAHLS